MSLDSDQSQRADQIVLSGSLPRAFVYFFGVQLFKSYLISKDLFVNEPSYISKASFLGAPEKWFDLVCPKTDIDSAPGLTSSAFS